MALIRCMHCYKQISDRAIKCPHCGKDVERPKDISLFCEDCGTEITAEYDSCPICGCPISNNCYTIQTNENKSSKSTQKSKPVQKKSPKSAIIICIITVVIFSVLFVISYNDLGEDPSDILHKMMSLNYEMTLQDICKTLGDDYTPSTVESRVTGSKYKRKSFTFHDHSISNFVGEVSVSLSCLKDQEFEKNGKLNYITWEHSDSTTNINMYSEIKNYICSVLGKPVEESDSSDDEPFAFWGDIKLSFSTPLLTEYNSISLSKNKAWEGLYTSNEDGETDRDHDWIDATCTEAKRCKDCGITEGEPLGHTVAIGYCERCEYQVTIYGLYEPQDVDAYYAVKKVVNQFKNPASVKVIAVHHYDEEDDDFYMTISAENSFGGITKDSYFISGSSILEAGTYSDRIDRDYNVGDINELLQKHYKSEGWK